MNYYWLARLRQEPTFSSGGRGKGRLGQSVIVKLMNNKICDICGAKQIVRDTLVRMCDECNKDFEEGMDYSDLTEILERRGIAWVSTKAIEYLTKKNI